MPDVAKRVADALREVVTVFYDEAGSIGRRYRRQDEAGTPYCITIDGQTLEDQTVTVRDRDSLLQERVAIDRLPSHVQSLLEAASP
jgi:glycyl-tRNA synthetase